MRFSTAVAVSAAALACSAAVLPTPAAHRPGTATPSTSSTLNKPRSSIPKSAVMLNQQRKTLTNIHHTSSILNKPRSFIPKSAVMLNQQRKTLVDAHRSTTRTPTKNTASDVRQRLTKTSRPAQTLTGAQRGQQDLSTARTDYISAQKEVKQAQSNLAASHKMERQGLGDYWLGDPDTGLKARDMDVEDILDSLATRGFFDKDELFGRGPGSGPSSGYTGPRLPTPPPPAPSAFRTIIKKVASGVTSTIRRVRGGDPTIHRRTKPLSHDGNTQNPGHGSSHAVYNDNGDLLLPGATSVQQNQQGRRNVGPTGTRREQQDLAARTDNTKARNAFNVAEGDLSTSHKMKQGGLSAYGPGNTGAGLKARDLDNVEELMEIIARGYYGANEEY